MKRHLFLAAISLLPLTIIAQPNYKVVIDLTSKDTMQHKAVLKWVNEIVKVEPKAEVEVVMYAQGVWMMAKDRSVVAGEIAKYAGNKNVHFNVCEVAMKNQKLDKSQLIPETGFVPDGIYEIISKQHQGWGYIKSGL